MKNLHKCTIFIYFFFHDSISTVLSLVNVWGLISWVLAGDVSTSPMICQGPLKTSLIFELPNFKVFELPLPVLSFSHRNSYSWWLDQLHSLACQLYQNNKPIIFLSIIILCIPYASQSTHTVRYIEWDYKKKTNMSGGPSY